jgi:hypothetical protein
MNTINTINMINMINTQVSDSFLPMIAGARKNKREKLAWITQAVNIRIFQSRLLLGMLQASLATID